MTRFSIVTVVYNDVKGLNLTYQSILSQTFRSFEWIVIDGSSTDGTVDYLKSLDNQYLVWSSENDQGIYDAMNKGIKKSSGEYLLFLNAGDVFPTILTLQSVTDVLSMRSDPDVVFGGVDLSFSNGFTLYRSPKNIEKSIWHGLPANHQATYYNRKSIANLKYDSKYKICGDYYLIAKLYKQGITVTYVNHSLVKFKVGGTSYINRANLFLEPYIIQRDVLDRSFPVRLLSLLKRLISTITIVSIQRACNRK